VLKSASRTTVEFRNHLLAALAGPDLHALLPSFVETPLARAQVLLEPGDEARWVYFPSSAVLSVVTTMLDGTSVETSSVGFETATPLLAALSKRPIKVRVFAQIGGAAIRVAAQSLRAQADASPTLRTLLLRHADAMAFQAEQGVACNALHHAPARLARWLLMTQDRTGNGALPLTQEYLAIMTGVQRTTISALANELRSAGLIAFRRGNVEIVDRAGLEKVACECYGVMRQEFGQL
jgi:CRP-like cAMP-binding protein